MSNRKPNKNQNKKNEPHALDEKKQIDELIDSQTHISNQLDEILSEFKEIKKSLEYYKKKQQILKLKFVT